MKLSDKIKLQLERHARQTKDKHEHTRLCVILARSEGMSHESIAQAHRISASSVYTLSSSKVWKFWNAS
jgi:DNA-directed RNA polymerase specialized sigma24 family protein